MIIVLVRSVHYHKYCFCCMYGAPTIHCADRQFQRKGVCPPAGSIVWLGRTLLTLRGRARGSLGGGGGGVVANISIHELLGTEKTCLVRTVPMGCANTVVGAGCF